MKEILEEVFKKMETKGLNLNDENNSSIFVELLNKEMFELQLSNKDYKIKILENALRKALKDYYFCETDAIIVNQSQKEYVDERFKLYVLLSEKELKEKADEKK